MGYPVTDMTGQRFGTFMVLGRTQAPPAYRSGVAFWSIRCDCGAERPYNGDLLRRGNARCFRCSKGRPNLSSVADVLAHNSQFVTECGCQIWTAATSMKGYGQFNKGGKDYLAHRASWTISHGPIPAGLWVLHRCDTPPCINPDHLFLGTAADNTADMIRKGRWVRPPNRWLNRRTA